MLRQGLLLVSRNCPRLKQLFLCHFTLKTDTDNLILLKRFNLFFPRLAPRLLSSHTVYFDSNEYATALYHKLSEKVI